MKTVSVMTLKEHVFDKVRRKPGDRYEVKIDPLSPYNVIHTLTTVGYARVIEPEEETQQQAAKGTYNRRDLRARH